MKNIFINSKEVNLTSRKESSDNFGCWFKENGTPDYFIKKCDEQIAKCKIWIDNLEELKRQKLIEKAEGHKEELRAMLAAMSPDERNSFIDNFKQ